jgi:hypothetical protein
MLWQLASRSIWAVRTRERRGASSLKQAQRNRVRRPPEVNQKTAAPEVKPTFLEPSPLKAGLRLLVHCRPTHAICPARNRQKGQRLATHTCIGKSDSGTLIEAIRRAPTRRQGRRARRKNSGIIGRGQVATAKRDRGGLLSAMGGFGRSRPPLQSRGRPCGAARLYLRIAWNCAM